MQKKIDNKKVKTVIENLEFISEKMKDVVSVGRVTDMYDRHSATEMNLYLNETEASVVEESGRNPVGTDMDYTHTFSLSQAKSADDVLGYMEDAFSLSAEEINKIKNNHSAKKFLEKIEDGCQTLNDEVASEEAVEDATRILYASETPEDFDKRLKYMNNGHLLQNARGEYRLEDDFKEKFPGEAFPDLSNLTGRVTPEMLSEEIDFVLASIRENINEGHIDDEAHRQGYFERIVFYFQGGESSYDMKYKSEHTVSGKLYNYARNNPKEFGVGSFNAHGLVHLDEVESSLCEIFGASESDWKRALELSSKEVEEFRQYHDELCEYKEDMKKSNYAQSVCDNSNTYEEACDALDKLETEYGEELPSRNLWADEIEEKFGKIWKPKFKEAVNDKKAVLQQAIFTAQPKADAKLNRSECSKPGCSESVTRNGKTFTRACSNHGGG